ncbi:tyrosine-type recombinase/integrase [Methanomethylovorans sp.]|uniref:tyrosine-type recombinase/integrase n=1 Tax=Methanomethylovorans sp. TaxID=2758717 RepID=UPI00351C7E77
MKQPEIRKDTIITTFFEMLSLKPATIQSYTNAMSAYTEYVGKNPQELLDEANAEVKAGKTLSERAMKKHILGFKKHLNDKQLAPTSISLYTAAVISFYKCYDLEIPRLPRAKMKVRPLEEHDIIPVREELQELLKVLDPLEKAVVLVGCSSGLSANEVIRLTVRQFKKGYDKDTGVTTIKMRRGKSGVDFITFFSPEASLAILDYLKYRERSDAGCKGFRKLQLKKQRVFSDDNVLFIRKNIDDRFLETYDEKYRMFDRRGFIRLYQRMSAKAGMSSPDGEWNVVRAHNMRKFYNSAMLNAGADSFFVEYTMGHALDGTKSAYFRASPDKLKDIYMRYVPYLTIAKEMNIADDPEYQRIAQENHAFAAAHGRLEIASELSHRKQQEQQREIEKLREDIEMLRLLTSSYKRLEEEDPNRLEKVKGKLNK